MSDPLDAWIDAVAPLLELDIAPEHRPAVRGFLKTAQEMARLLEEAPLDDAEFSQAPVYLPPDAEGEA